MNTRHSRGFSLIELMVAITVLGILTSLGLPSFGRWMVNIQLRNMGESVQNGLRLAQREAASRNGSVVFTLTSATSPGCSSTPITAATATSGTNWVVCSGSSLIQQNVAKAGSANAEVTSDFSSITFDGLGRTNLNVPSQVSIKGPSGTCETASTTGPRCLNLLVSPGGKVRLCDPLLPAGDPAACS